MTHWIKHVSNMAIVGLSLTAATSAFADHPDYVRVRGLTYAGSGCPISSVAANVSADREAFTLLFDQYVAEVGPGVPFREKRKNCQLNIDFDYPQGWSFSIFSVDVRGYVALERGVRASQQTSIYTQGQTQTTVLRTVMTGPRDENYTVRDVLGVDNTWSPCGVQRSLNLNTQIILDNGGNSNRSGLMTVDSIDGEVHLIYGVRWRRC